MNIYDLGEMENRRRKAAERRIASVSPVVRLSEARSIITDLVSAGDEFDEHRVKPRTIQVDWSLIERAKKWLKGGE
jgi:hypothetical protein